MKKKYNIYYEKKPFNNSNVKRLGSAIAENTQKVRLNEFLEE